MAYLSLNFVVPDDFTEVPDSVEVVAVEGGKFFLRLSWNGKEIRYLYPPNMHMVYNVNVGCHRHCMIDLCRDLFRENGMCKNGLQKENEKKLVSEKFPKRSRSKKS